MARQLAKNALVMVSATEVGSPTTVEALAAWDIDLSCSEVDVTGIYDSNKQYIPGQGDAKGSFTVILDPESETLDMLETAQKSQALVYLFVRLEGTGSGKSQIKAPVYITGWKISSSNDSRVEVAVSWVAGGDLDHTAQAGA
ncbi:hypothetical protein [Cloacibacillus evryensis]|uniref:hypothetical protein n=1 Tax=Cloacibacillus evryensis TaxID=508460 RepID=UPI0004AD401A|nr:hypothetical protein [Cloacibacillus evryensis]